jgi:F-type H+-transporting ATPase subunit alpha
MKKVAGTLKLDQAQFRELEAFAKFGSDLDDATKRTIDRGRKNQGILKQPQFSPMPVEEQVALIFASTKGFLDKVPVTKVKEFQAEYLQTLRLQGREALADLKSGKLTDEAIEKLSETASDIATRFN